jgi:hypothetical protein
VTFEGGRGGFVTKTFGIAFEEMTSAEDIFLFFATGSSIEAPFPLLSVFLGSSRSTYFTPITTKDRFARQLPE